MVTIKDVAARAGVSTATVSNYLNKTKPVRKATEAKIKRAIEELQYHQNLSARSLKASVYTDVGVVLPNLDDPYYVQIFQGIEAVFQNSPYFLNLVLTYDVPEVEHNMVKNMLRKNICGLILVTCCPDDWKFYYENFNRYDRPIVLLDRAIPNLDCSFITFDSKRTIQTITRTLLRQDYDKIFILAGPEQYTSEHDCVDGFLEAYREEEREPHALAINHIELNKEHAFRTMASLLRKEKPNAVVTTSSLVSDGVLEALYVLGYTVEDIRLLTLGQEHWNKYTRTRSNFFTARPAIKMGNTAANLLIEQIRLPLLTENQHIILESNMDPGVALQYKYFLQSNDAVFFTVDDLIQMDRVMPREYGDSLCMRQADKPVALRILMVDTPYVHTVCNLVRNFEVLTGVKTQIDILPHWELYNAIMQDFQSEWQDKTYDVYMYDVQWLSQIVSRGVLADLTDYVAHIGEDVFLTGSMERFGGFLGRQYGLPFLCTPQVLYYRKDLFDDLSICTGFEKQYGSTLRPPLTFMEFNAVAEYFTFHTDAIPYGCSVAAAYHECLAPEIYTRLLANGGQIIDEKGHVLFNTPETLRTYVNFMRTLTMAKPDYRTATDSSIAEDFLNGQTAMLISYPSFMTEVADLRKSSLIGSIGYSYIPGRSSLMGGWGLGVASSSKHIPEAAEFIKWTCSEQMSGYFALNGTLGAVANTYCNDELVKLFPWLPLYQAANKNTRTVFPSVINGKSVIPSTSIDEIVCRWVYQMMDKKCSVEDAIQNTQWELEAFIAQELSENR